MAIARAGQSWPVIIKRGEVWRKSLLAEVPNEMRDIGISSSHARVNLMSAISQRKRVLNGNCARESEPQRARH